MNLRYIKKSEINLLKKFIKKNWFKKNHILSKKNNLLEYHYNFKNKKKTNFIGFFYKKKLCGIVGLIKYSNWSNKISDVVFLAFILKKKKSPDILNKLFFFLKKKKCQLIACSGFNETIKQYYSRIGMVTTFDHLYIFNKNIKKRISKNLKSKKNKKSLLKLNISFKNK